MKLLKHRIMFVCLAVLSACSTGKHPIPVKETEDYRLSENWYLSGKETNPDFADVFYILETCVYDWTDDNGRVHHHANLDSREHRKDMKNVFDRAYSIFGDSTNFFAPYYKQITLDVWMDGLDSVAVQTPKAYDDVKAAFDYYMEYWNNGRKFALAGFSQGGMLVKQLMKDMTDEQFERMAAAYVIGFPVYPEDLAESPRFVAATGPEDSGVTISFNSVDDEKGVGDLFRGSTMIINPVSWSTSTEVAQVNDTVNCHINKEEMMLFVDGIDPMSIYIPSLASCFPIGNYHLLEMVIYAEHLRKNVKQRLY